MGEEFFQIVFWVIVAVIYIISAVSGGNKKKTVNKRPSKPRLDQSNQKPKTRSLEDILREIQSERNQEQKPTSSSFSFTEQDSSFNQGKFYDDTSNKEFNPAPMEVDESYIKKAKKRLKQTETKKRKKGENVYRKMFDDPKSVKNAFIMSEIFKRKF